MQTIISPQKFLRFTDRLDGPPRPPHYDIDPSSRCNHACRLCPTIGIDEHNIDTTLGIPLERIGMAKENRAFLDFKRLVRLIDEIRENQGRAITFVGGGEPTLHPRITDILHKTHQTGLRYGLISHFGLPYKESFFEELANATWVRVSMNAATPQTYAQVQGTKVTEFLNVLKNIQRLVHTRGVKELPRIGISFLVAPENFVEIERAAVMAKNLGADFVQYKPLVTGSRGAIFESIRPIIDANLALARGHASRSFQVLDQFAPRLAELEDQWAGKFSGRCWVPWMNPKIAADGIASCCCELAYSREGVLGDIYKEDLRTILNRIPEVMAKIDMKGCPVCWEKASLNALVNAGIHAAAPSPPESPDQDFV